MMAKDCLTLDELKEKALEGKSWAIRLLERLGLLEEAGLLAAE